MFNCITYTPKKAVIPENKRLRHLHAQIALPGLLHPGAIADPAYSSAVGRGSVMERWNRRIVVSMRRRVAAAGRSVGEKGCCICWDMNINRAAAKSNGSPFLFPFFTNNQ